MFFFHNDYNELCHPNVLKKMQDHMLLNAGCLRKNCKICILEFQHEFAEKLFLYRFFVPGTLYNSSGKPVPAVVK